MLLHGCINRYFHWDAMKLLRLHQGLEGFLLVTVTTEESQMEEPPADWRTRPTHAMSFMMEERMPEREAVITWAMVGAACWLLLVHVPRAALDTCACCRPAQMATADVRAWF